VRVLAPNQAIPAMVGRDRKPPRDGARRKKYLPSRPVRGRITAVATGGGRSCGRRPQTNDADEQYVAIERRAESTLKAGVLDRRRLNMVVRRRRATSPGARYMTILDVFLKHKYLSIVDVLMLSLVGAGTWACYTADEEHQVLLGFGIPALILAGPWTLQVILGTLLVGYSTFRQRLAWHDFVIGFLVFYGSLVVSAVAIGVFFLLGTVFSWDGETAVYVVMVPLGLIALFGIVPGAGAMLNAHLGGGLYLGGGATMERVCGRCGISVSSWRIATDGSSILCPVCGVDLRTDEL